MLFRNIIGFYPIDISYYKQAVTHASAHLLDSKGRVINNERLEFLGDAVLDSTIADILFKQYPNRGEGFLTNTRSKIVCREHLNELGLKFGLDKIMNLGTSSKKSHNNYIYGNCLEALIGAIYLDSGYRKVKEFIANKIIDKDISEFARSEINYKSRVLEWCQAKHYEYEFKLDKTEVDDNGNPLFFSSIWINGMKIATAKGYTKKESHQIASKRAMRKLRYDKKLTDTLASLAPTYNPE